MNSPAALMMCGELCPRFGGALEVIFQSDDFAPKRGEMFHIHTHPTSIFKDVCP